MSTEPDLTPSEREADRNAAEARAGMELREAIAQVIRDTDGTHFSTGIADAVIAGPLAGLLAELERHRAGREVEQEMLRNAIEMLSELDSLRAENERLREHSPSPAVMALIERSSLGTEEAKAARASVSPDAGRLVVRLSHVMADLDRLRAQVEAVRAEVEQWDNGTARAVLAILNAADGGAASDSEVG